jgi:hypothetical protein
MSFTAFSPVVIDGDCGACPLQAPPALGVFVGQLLNIIYIRNILLIKNNSSCGNAAAAGGAIFPIHDMRGTGYYSRTVESFP